MGKSAYVAIGGFYVAISMVMAKLWMDYDNKIAEKAIAKYVEQGGCGTAGDMVASASATAVDIVANNTTVVLDFLNANMTGALDTLNATGLDTGPIGAGLFLGGIVTQYQLAEREMNQCFGVSPDRGMQKQPNVAALYRCAA